MRFTTVPIPQGATISSAYINVNTLPDGLLVILVIKLD